MNIPPIIAEMVGPKNRISSLLLYRPKDLVNQAKDSDRRKPSKYNDFLFDMTEIIDFISLTKKIMDDEKRNISVNNIDCHSVKYI
jgi:hypothetical protein